LTNTVYVLLVLEPDDVYDAMSEVLTLWWWRWWEQ